MDLDKKKNVIVAMAVGFEEIETLTFVDLLRRCDANVVLASTMGKDYGLLTPGRSGIKVMTDAYFEDVCDNDYDLVVIGGGKNNAEYLGKYKPLLLKFQKQRDEGKWFAAICASPQLVLDANNLIDNFKATSFHNFPLKNCTVVNERVVVDKNLVTSRSPGTAMEFA